MKYFNYLLVALLALGVASCKKEDPTLGPAPSAGDAAFTATPTTANPNIVDFKLNNTDIRATWDLGNGSTGSGNTITGTYPSAGTYTVTVNVFTSGGSATSSQDITIAQDDPSLLSSPLFDLLTGGTGGSGSKAWVIDSANDGHFGLGPDPIGAAGNSPEWYSAGALEKAGVGMYDDRYEFSIIGFQFDMKNNGDVYVHNTLAGDFPGSVENLTDYTAPYTEQLGETWTITEGSDTTLTVSGTSFLGMYTGVQTYRILSLTDTSMFLQYKHHDGGFHWYLRLIPEGFVPNNGGGGTPTFSLPLDFEGTPPVFTTFGNSTFGVIANPDMSGINTSANVLETVHGNETWAGLFVDLDAALDFSTNTTITLKVWAPVTGDFRFKVENSSDTNDFVELDAVVTTANAWEEISVDFVGSTSGVYDRLVVFPGWNVANAGTFYLDDIAQQ